jgi:hypothetical protein
MLETNLGFEVFRCTEQARIENAGKPTFMMHQVSKRMEDVDESRRRWARDVEALDEQIVQLE